MESSGAVPPVPPGDTPSPGGTPPPPGGTPPPPGDTPPPPGDTPPPPGDTPPPPGDTPPPPGGTPPLPPPGGAPPPPSGDGYPLTYSVDYPDRALNRITTALRIFWAIPIFILAGAIEGGGWSTTSGGRYAGGGVGILVIPVLLMLLFRKKYPRWWWEWNLQLTRFSNRIVAYVALMSDRYPSTDEQQAVRLDFSYPDAERDLQRGMPLIKWLLAIPHYIVLFFLDIGALVVLIVAWFAIVITARYPRSLFDYIEGVIRWHNRVGAYAFLLITDRYPPFSLRA